MPLTPVTLKYSLPLWGMMALTLIVLQYGFVPPTYVCLHPTSQPLGTSISCFASTTQVLLRPCEWEHVLFFYFCVWLILVNTVSSRFSRVTINARVSFFGWIVFHWRCIPCLLSSLFTGRHSRVLWLGHCECSSVGIPQPPGLLFSLP